LATLSPTRVWLNHEQDGQVYTLTHLHPVFLTFSAPALPAQLGRPARPAKTFRVRSEYSHHCFTQDPSKLEFYDAEHLYSWIERPNDPRVFSLQRYEDSKLLPNLVASLDQRNVYPSRHSNHFAVKRASPEGHYSIWFRVERATNFHRMVVESAYRRSDMDEQIAHTQPTTLIDVLVNTR